MDSSEKKVEKEMYSSEKKVEKEMELSRIRVMEDDYKQNQRLQRKITYLQQKYWIAEVERERKKSQSDLIFIDENGKILVQTTNLQIDVKVRSIANFSQPEIVIFERLKNENQKIFLFVCNQNQKVKYTFFADGKCGSPSYLLKKLNSVGAEIFATTLAVKKQYASQLITLLIHNAQKCVKLPDRREWYIDENRKIQFFQGRWTWEEALKCTN